MRPTETDRHKDRPRYSICSNRPHLRHYVHKMWPINIAGGIMMESCSIESIENSMDF